MGWRGTREQRSREWGELQLGNLVAVPRPDGAYDLHLAHETTAPNIPALDAWKAISARGLEAVLVASPTFTPALLMATTPAIAASLHLTGTPDGTECAALPRARNRCVVDRRCR